MSSQESELTTTGLITAQPVTSHNLRLLKKEFLPKNKKSLDSLQLHNSNTSVKIHNSSKFMALQEIFKYA